MTLVVVAFLVTGALLLLSGFEHKSLFVTVDQILSGQYYVQRQSAS